MYASVGISARNSSLSELRIVVPSFVKERFERKLPARPGFAFPSMMELTEKGWVSMVEQLAMEHPAVNGGALAEAHRLISSLDN